MRFLALFGALLISNGCLLLLCEAADDDITSKPTETGAIELREVLREAIKADVERYPFGEIECQIVNRNLEGPSNEQRATVHSWWLNDDSFTTLQVTSKTDPTFIRSHSPVRGIQTHTIALERTICKNQVMILNRDSNRATIGHRSTTSRLQNAAVTPADFWFGKIDGEGRNWDWALGPGARGPVDAVKRYDADLLPGDRMKITVTYNGDGGSYRAIASLNHWKILSFDATTKNNGKPQTISYEYTWDPEEHYLQTLIYRAKDADTLTYERVYSVTSSAFRTRPAPERFRIDERQIPEGYLIDNKITKRQYWQGNINTDINKALERMSTKLRTSGFLLNR